MRGLVAFNQVRVNNFNDTCVYATDSLVEASFMKTSTISRPSLSPTLSLTVLELPGLHALHEATA